LTCETLRYKLLLDFCFEEFLLIMARATRSSSKKSPVAKKVEAKVVKTKSTEIEKVSKTNAKKEVSNSDQNVVSIEHCKQWGAFKSRANKIAKAIGNKARVDINIEKPGKGNFVVRVIGMEQPVVELLAMKRPFPSLKNLDIDDVCKKVLEALETA